MLGLVVTPSRTPHLAAVRISSVSAVSRNIFIRWLLARWGEPGCGPRTELYAWPGWILVLWAIVPSPRPQARPRSEVGPTTPPNRSPAALHSGGSREPALDIRVLGPRRGQPPCR